MIGNEGSLFLINLNWLPTNNIEVLNKLRELRDLYAFRIFLNDLH